MPEQPVRRQAENDSDQQIIYFTIRKLKGDTHENNRYRGSGRIQCRN